MLDPKGEKFLVFMGGRRKGTVKLLSLKVYLLTYNYSIVDMGGVARKKVPLVCANREEHN